MAKGPTITTVSTGYLSASQINTNFENIDDAFDNTLSLDGSTPNSMGADFDMNNNDILNAGEINTDTLKIAGINVTSVEATPDWKGAWTTATSYIINDLVREDGSTYICVEAHTSGTFSTDLSASKWELFAQKGAAGAGTGDLLAANNLSDLSNAATSRSNLGVAIGSQVQGWDDDLDDLAALSHSDGNIIVSDGTDWTVESGATARASLGLTIGAHVQAFNSTLLTIATNGNVTANEIAAGAVDTTQLASNSVTAGKISAGAVGASEIAANSVGNSEMQNNAIDTAELVDNAVTADKLDETDAYQVSSLTTTLYLTGGTGSAAEAYRSTGTGNQNTFIVTSDDASTRGTVFTVQADGDVLIPSGKTYGNTSDERVKKNIRDHGPAMSEMKTIKVRKFENKNGGPEANGFVAQEVQETLPELVGEGEDGLLYVRTSEFIPKLVRAVQELKDEVDELRDEIEKLKRRP